MKNLLVGAALVLAAMTGTKSHAQFSFCPSVKDKPYLNVRNFIPGSTIIAMFSTKVNSSDFDYKNPENEVLSASGVGPIAGVPFAAAESYCGQALNFKTKGIPGTCNATKASNIYNIRVLLRRNGAIYSVDYAKDICGESNLDITPGTRMALFQVVIPYLRN